MVTVEHPNGCIHIIPESLLDKFLAAGWKVKAAPSEPSAPAPKKTRKK